MQKIQGQTNIFYPKRNHQKICQGDVIDFNRPGRENLLCRQEVAALIEYIQNNASHNFPLKRPDVRSVVLVCSDDT